MKLEWGIRVGPNCISEMPDEQTADQFCDEGQHVVFRYVGDWTKA